MSKAYVLFNCESGSDDYVVSQLKSIESVKEAYGTFGVYDVIAKLESHSDDSLKGIVARKIRKLDRIRGTSTLLVDEEQQFVDENHYQVLENTTNYSAAYIVIQCGQANEHEIFIKLQKIPEVVVCDVVIGSYEIICKIIAPTYNDISSVVSKKIRNLGMIRTTMTLNIVTKST